MTVKVTKRNDVYKASRITGPKHNYLGLILSKTPSEATALLPHKLNNEPSVIDETKMVVAVAAGIDDANRSINTPLYAQAIEYVPSDTPDYSAYSQLAKAIVEAASADFVREP